MKRKFLLLLLLLPTLLFSQTPVTFDDPNLEQAIRDALSKPSGDITDIDMQTLTVFSADSRNISDLTGLEYATNLNHLSLNMNNITNIGPLEDLTKIKQIYLFQNNISNITPLHNMTDLEIAYMHQNQILDISPLADAHKLTHLYLYENNFIDISVASNFPEIERLLVGGNPIHNILSLRNLTTLQHLDLSYTDLANNDLVHLYKLDNLEELDLRGVPNISSGTAVKILSDSLASLSCASIKWDGACEVNPPDMLVFLDDFHAGNADSWQARHAAQWSVSGTDPAYSVAAATRSALEYSLIQGYHFLKFDFLVEATSATDPASEGAADMAVVFAFVDSLNYYCMNFSSVNSENVLYKMQAGVKTILGQFDGPTLTSTSPNFIRITRDTRHIEVTFNGQQLLHLEDLNVILGNIGVGSTSGGISFDDLSIYAIGERYHEIGLLSPNGGNIWKVDNQYPIRWASTGVDGNVSISFSGNNGTNWSSLVSSTANDGRWDWTPGRQHISKTCLIKIADLTNTYSDTSDAPFVIIEDITLSLTSPNGGEEWEIDNEYPITWQSTGELDSVMISFSKNNGTSWTVIQPATPNDGSWTWTPTSDKISTTCLIKVSDTNGYINDVSDASFTVFKAPTLPESWSFSTNSDVTCRVTLPLSIHPTIYGQPLQNADYVGVFSPDGKCCGYGQWLEQDLNFTVMGDMSTTPELEGLRSDERMMFRIYRLAAATEWDLVFTSFSQGSSRFQPSSQNTLSAFFVEDADQQMFSFQAGWNLISCNMTPIIPDLSTVLDDFDNFVLLRDQRGYEFNPSAGVFRLRSLNAMNGYYVYLTDADSILIYGSYVNSAEPMPLKAGWHTIGYLPSSEMSVDAAMASIRSNLIMSKTGDGRVYCPGYGINEIGIMSPGSGYWVYLAEDDTLVYPQSSQVTNTGTSAPQTSHFTHASNTDNSAVIILSASIVPQYKGGNRLAVRDEIGVFNDKGMCCGSIVWNETNRAIVVWGDDSQTQVIDGALPGEPLSFKVWNSLEKKEYAAEVKYLRSEQGVYDVNNFLIFSNFEASLETAVDGNTEANIPDKFELSQNYPNPFNPETTIRYTVPDKSVVTITIFDMLGKQIVTLVNKEKDAGHHHVVFDASGLSSGIYFCKMTSANFSSMRKMTFMK
ncbi:T9SS type A sorting domain-containing protein [candidate division KSB1 bacterium]|nr:T9SS type A sorting domain-containing protein [candidate division KSB1 bacterium]